jgi:phenylalanyl-tRNA synthetase alpha chain
MDKNLLESLHSLEIKTLLAFKDKILAEEEIIGKKILDPAQIRRAVEWLKTKEIINIECEEPKPLVKLSSLGLECAENGIPEIRIFKQIKESDKTTIKDLQSIKGMEIRQINTAFGNLKKAGIISIKEGGAISIEKEDALAPFNEIQNLVNKVKKSRGHEIRYEQLSPHEKEIADKAHRKRGKSKEIFIIDENIKRNFCLTELGEKILKELKASNKTGEEISQLTSEMLSAGTWRGKNFRKYNLDIKPPRPLAGRKHPYREFLDFVKQSLISLGFQEMRGSIIETAFWNMDALYMPQFHSARDIHDVYFIKEPKYAREIQEPFLSNVASTHNNGWETGSQGWRYQFDKNESKRLLLRSQGTALSVRKLAENIKVPGKYFAIARCFRYEQTDATHAAEFLQIEGIVIDKDINFKNLLGLLKTFALEVAKAEEVKFHPDYFPFTEPSVEASMKHKKLGWIELGGAGIFRPEVTKPLGIDVPVIAWGLGLDRMAMVALDIQDIRELFSSDLELIRNKTLNLLG